ncbi:transglutaminase domain-containing protein [Psychroserpens sp.]|uniref:transglutaminase domain-containing protein n=1 Tax=Psychroserpens sp. TaxID=2020870 RepID=UPI002B2646EC|nr:transglutaminase domain-containing protein [Psychroserpens sp.]
MNKITMFLVFVCHISFAQLSDFKSLDFTRADNIASLNTDASLNNLPALAHNLTSKLSTDVEKFRAIYNWVCNNVTGDVNQYNKVGLMRRKLLNDSIAFMAWNESFKRVAFKTLLKHKKTMCTGYAYLIKELCFLANLECVIVDGYARSVDSNVDELEAPNHSWNAVKLNNKWYLSDATWSSGYMLSGTTFVKDFNKGYFLADPILFAKNHYPLRKKWLLHDVLTEEEFVSGPLVYDDTFKHQIIPVFPEKMKTKAMKNTEVVFSFKSSKQISTDKISLVKLSKKNQTILKIYDFKTENGVIKFKHQFKQKGLQDVHLKINNDIVATYTIDVTKI